MKKYKIILKEQIFEIAISSNYDFIQNLESFYKTQYFLEVIKNSNSLPIKKQTFLIKKLKNKTQFLTRRLFAPLKNILNEGIKREISNIKKEKIEELLNKLEVNYNSYNINLNLQIIEECLQFIITDPYLFSLLKNITNINEENLNNLKNIISTNVKEWDKELQLLNIKERTIQKIKKLLYIENKKIDKEIIEAEKNIKLYQRMSDKEMVEYWKNYYNFAKKFKKMSKKEQEQIIQKGLTSQLEEFENTFIKNINNPKY